MIDHVYSLLSVHHIVAVMFFFLIVVVVVVKLYLARVVHLALWLVSRGALGDKLILQ